MKKLFNVISILSIAIATLGFLYIPHHYDTQINQNIDEIATLAFNEDRTIMNIQESQRCYDIAVTQRDHADILRILSNLPGAKERDDYMLKGLQGAVISAIKAAQVSNAISEKDQIDMTTKVNNLKSYEEIWPVYVDYLEKAQGGVKKMRQRSFSLQGKNNNLRLNKDKLWYASFGFQSLGIISALLAVLFHRNKKYSDRKTKRK